MQQHPVSSLESVKNQLNAAIDQWMAWLNDYHLDALRQIPPDGSWSLGQVYRHIIDETEYFIGQAGICMSANDNAGFSMNEQGRRILANGFPDAKLQGPSTGVDIPQPASVVQLRQALIQIKADAARIFKADLTRNNGKTAHPGFAWFNAPEWLQFAGLHLQHHVRQKKRIDEALKSVK